MGTAHGMASPCGDGASVGILGTARAQYHLRQSFIFLNMYPVNQPEVMIANAAERFDADGNLVDEKAKDLIRQLLRALVAWTRRLESVSKTESKRPCRDFRMSPGSSFPHASGGIQVPKAWTPANNMRGDA